MFGLTPPRTHPLLARLNTVLFVVIDQPGKARSPSATGVTELPLGYNLDCPERKAPDIPQRWVRLGTEL